MRSRQQLRQRWFTQCIGKERYIPSPWLLFGVCAYINIRRFSSSSGVGRKARGECCDHRHLRSRQAFTARGLSRSEEDVHIETSTDHSTHTLNFVRPSRNTGSRSQSLRPLPSPTSYSSPCRKRRSTLLQVSSIYPLPRLAAQATAYASMANEVSRYLWFLALGTRCIRHQFGREERRDHDVGCRRGRLANKDLTCHSARQLV